jgi:hypothetical protein
VGFQGGKIVPFWAKESPSMAKVMDALVYVTSTYAKISAGIL